MWQVALGSGKQVTTHPYIYIGPFTLYAIHRPPTRVHRAYACPLRCSVFDVCSTLQPSARGELEITGVNNHYIQHGQMDWLALHCWWSDVGTFEGIRDATELVRRFGANQEGNGSAGRGLHLAGDHGAAADGFLCSSAAAPRSTGMADQALRVLVTGGSGFIGSHFVRLLLHTRPAWSVANFDLLTYAGRANNLRDVEHMPNYTFIQVRVSVSVARNGVCEVPIAAPTPRTGTAYHSIARQHAQALRAPERRGVSLAFSHIHAPVTYPLHAG